MNLEALAAMEHEHKKNPIEKRESDERKNKEMNIQMEIEEGFLCVFTLMVVCVCVCFGIVKERQKVRA